MSRRRDGLIGVAAMWLMFTLFFCGIVIWSATRCRAHDGYEKWMRPDGRGSCCSNKDCFPTRAFWNGKNWVAIYRDGTPVDVPASAVLPFSTDDGNAHLCASKAVFSIAVFCFVPPQARY